MSCLRASLLPVSVAGSVDQSAESSSTAVDMFWRGAMEDATRQTCWASRRRSTASSGVPACIFVKLCLMPL